MNRSNKKPMKRLQNWRYAWTQRSRRKESIIINWWGFLKLKLLSWHLLCHKCDWLIDLFVLHPTHEYTDGSILYGQQCRPLSSLGGIFIRALDIRPKDWPEIESLCRMVKGHIWIPSGVHDGHKAYIFQTSLYLLTMLRTVLCTACLRFFL